MVSALLKSISKGTDEQKSSEKSIKATITIGDTSIDVEASDLEDAKSMMRLAQHLQTNHPTIANEIEAIKTIKTIKIKGIIPQSRQSQRQPRRKKK